MVEALMDVERPEQVKPPAQPERPLYRSELDLVALPTAATVARLFISDTLRRWNALFIERHMARVAVELVELSIEQTGPTADVRTPGSIKLQMLGYRRHIVFEVTDRHDKPLELPPDADVPEGHGLGLVDALANRWGSSVGGRGRVNWAEIAVYGRTDAGLPLRDPQAPGWSPPSDDEPAAPLDDDFLRKVRDGLEQL